MKRKTLSGFIILLFCILSLFAGCQGKGTESQTTDGRLLVYTSFYPIYDFAQKIGGDKVRVVNMVPAGIEPHDWEPASRDIANLTRAQVFLYNGAGMEGWVDKILSSLPNKHLIVVETAQGMDYLANKNKEENLQYDPHTWLNPLNAKKQMEAIKNALQKADPHNKDYYEKNYQTNAKKLDELDQEYKRTLGGCRKKEIVVAHQAFGYLCHAYGLKQVAIEGLSADSEPSPAKMVEITKFAKEHGVRYIFFEELISPKVAKVLAKQVAAETEILNPLEGLSPEEVKAGKEYFSVMRDNLTRIKRALE